MARREYGSKSGRRRGFALMIVLILVIVLTVVVFILQREVAREISVGTNVRDDLSASLLARLALVRGQAVLVLDEHMDYDSLNETWSQPMTWTGEKFGREDGDSGEGSGQFQEPKVLISDEERKFNLLLLVRGTKEQREGAVEIFKRLIGICRREDDRLRQYLDGEAKTVRRSDDDTANTDTLVRNLLKYLEERASEDSDDLEFTANTGKKPDVRGMKKQTPYQMLTLGELLQVEGWTSELLFGKPRVSQGQQESSEPDNRPFTELSDEEQFDRTRDELDQLDTRSRDPEPLPLIHFLTLYSSGRININTCSRELLLALDERLTWDVVDQIVTAREQDRRDVMSAEENGGTLPEEEPSEPGATEEDLVSFRPQDIASYQAFVARATNEEAESGGQQITLEGFTEEIYTAIRPLLSVRSTIFRVEASAKVGKIANSIYAIYRRTGAQANTNNNPNNNNGNNNANNGNNTNNPGTNATGTSTTGEMPLPPEPTARLTLLFKDVKQE